MESVSIIVPVYCRNEQDLAWLGECLASVEGQADEIVIWDDGSPVDVVAPSKYACGKGDHKGVSAARNSAVRLARTDLIFPVDCDDVLVPDAISTMLAHWDGVPMYSDVYKFGVDNIPHYQLLDFNCDILAKKVGIAGVGVLHSKQQWEAVGGWDERLDFYEDGEYNARLFLNYCARHVRLPLYGYRSHANQRTKLNEHRSVQMMRKVLAMVQDYERSMTMGCPGCGPRRTRPTNPRPVTATRSSSDRGRGSFQQRVAELPGSSGDGKVFAHYIGGAGKGTHYYRGPVTRFAYKVRHDDIVSGVDPRDTSDPDDPNRAQRSLLVRVKKEEPAPPTPIPTPAPVRRAPKQELARVPVEEKAETVVEELADVPDISNIPYRKLVTLDIDPEMAARLLEIEKVGRARVKHLAYLRRRVASDS